MRVLILAAALTAFAAPAPATGVIERACVKSDRSAATRTACNCIQDVANIKLSRAEQKFAAKFFSDPHLSQEIRQSDHPSNERFWKKYKEFGTVAARNCT